MKRKMRRFRVEVGGKVYEVKVEEIEETGQPVVQEVVQEVKPPSDPAPTAETVTALRVEERGPSEGTVVAPMPGVILRINVGVGDLIRAGDVIAILEAMKMENEIISHKSGTIKGIYVSEGEPVDTGKLIAVIE